LPLTCAILSSPFKSRSMVFDGQLNSALFDKS